MIHDREEGEEGGVEGREGEGGWGEGEGGTVGWSLPYRTMAWSWIYVSNYVEVGFLTFLRCINLSRLAVREIIEYQ